MKLCKDCKYYVPPTTYSHYSISMCSHPNTKRDLVYGNLAASCGMTRGSISGVRCKTEASICGEEALLFEAKPPAPDSGVFIYAPEETEYRGRDGFIGWLKNALGLK